jgi:hypothetical protein
MVMDENGLNFAGNNMLEYESKKKKLTEII